jgi:pimeloyl-ACP methyl ester carboxylesterase
LKPDKYFTFFLLVSFGLITLILATQLTKIASGQITTTIPTISTRNHFKLSNGELNSVQTPTSYIASPNIPGSKVGTTCPPELAIYIHGVWVGSNSLEKPEEIFDRAKKSIAANNFTIPLVGFSWDSDTKILPPDGTGWTTAKVIAKENGPKLAQFISDYKNKCQTTEIRLIAHSMGARVVLSTLESLYKNQAWNDKNFKIASVHLMGAAVDDEEVAKSPSYINKDPSILLDIKEWYDVYGIKSADGHAIEKEVVKFYNLFNPQDNALQTSTLYPFFELDHALGLEGAQIDIRPLSNYLDINVQDEIPVIPDANGNGKCDLTDLFGCTIENIGDNHFGYVGFEDKNGKLIDDGAMNIVVNNWKKS